MDAHLLRSVGIAMGAAALAGALAVSRFAPEAAPGALSEPPPAVRALAADDPSNEAPPAERPDAVAPDAAFVSFLVRFQGAGPLAQSQALAERGHEAEARRAAEDALARQSAFRGLCFDRFTAGGAEMVLRSCAPVAASAQAQATAEWLARLRDMSAIAYADINATADPAQPQ